MTTDTLLAFRDKHPEAWPDDVLGPCKSNPEIWVIGMGDSLYTVRCEDAHALIESKVMDAMADPHSFGVWRLMPPLHLGHDWHVHFVYHRYQAPTRLEALIEAYKAEMKGQDTNGDD